jgi:hypothetical protein
MNLFSGRELRNNNYPGEPRNFNIKNQGLFCPNIIPQSKKSREMSLVETKNPRQK